jgi:hypothetical protein
MQQIYFDNFLQLGGKKEKKRNATDNSNVDRSFSGTEMSEAGPSSDGFYVM